MAKGHADEPVARRLWFWEPADALTPRVLVLVLLVMAALLRVQALDSQGLWLDELATDAVAHLPLDQQLVHLSHDMHPPLYTFLMHFWLKFGDSDRWLRGFSALFGLGICYLAYRLGCELVSRNFGRLLLWMAAFSPFLVWMSQEGRSFTLFGTEYLLMVLAGLRLLRVPAAPGAWLLYGFSVTAQLYTHYYALCTVTPLALLLLAVRWRTPGLARRWLLVHVLVVLCYSPWLPVLHGQCTWSTNVGYGSAKVSAGQRLDTMLRRAAAATEPFWALSIRGETRALPVVPGLLGLAMLGLAAGTLGFWRIRRELAGPWYLAPVLAAGTFAVACLLSLVLGPNFLMPRYLIGVFLLGLAVSSAALISTGRWWLVVGCLVVLLRWQMAITYDLYRTPRDQFREAGALVKSQAAPGDAVLFTRESLRWINARYFGGGPVGLAVPVTGNGRSIPYDVQDVLYRMTEAHLLALRDQVAPYRRLWVVAFYGGRPAEARPELELLGRRLGEGGLSLAWEQALAGVIVQRYERPARRPGGPE